MRAGVAKRAYYIGYTSFPMPGLKFNLYGVWKSYLTS